MRGNEVSNAWVKKTTKDLDEIKRVLSKLAMAFELYLAEAGFEIEEESEETNDETE